MRKIVLSVLALLFFLTTGCGGKAGQGPSGRKIAKGLTLAASQSLDSYGSLGNDLAASVDQDGRTPSLKALESSGSLANIELLRQEKADLALVQSDVAWYARTGSGIYQDRALDDLQQVGVLYPETVQIITYDLTGIRKLQDLKGKTVSVGAAGSGSSLNARQILEAAGLTEDDVRVQYLSVTDTVRALKEGTVDAAFLTSSLPHPALKELARQRRLVLIPVEGQALDDLLGAYPLYQPVTIPVGTYPNQTRSCSSVGVQCLLVARERLSQESLAGILQRFWPHWGELQRKYPWLPRDAEKTFFQAPVLPLAPGAEQFRDGRKVSS